MKCTPKFKKIGRKKKNEKWNTEILKDSKIREHFQKTVIEKLGKNNNASEEKE